MMSVFRRPFKRSTTYRCIVPGCDREETYSQDLFPGEYAIADETLVTGWRWSYVGLVCDRHKVKVFIDSIDVETWPRP